MQNMIDKIAGFLGGLLSAAEGIVTSLTAVQILLIIAALVALVIILICALSGANQRTEKIQDELSEKEQEFDRQRKQSLSEMEEKRFEMSDRVREKEVQLQNMQQNNEQLQEKVVELERFKADYSVIPDARAEASRIIRDAKDYAFVMGNRSDMEYTEIMEHANEEAEAIRAMAQERLKHSHEVLKKALSRAGDIIAEAHAEAARLNSEAYLSAPAAGMLEEPENVEQTPEMEDQPAATVEKLDPNEEDSFEDEGEQA